MSEEGSGEIIIRGGSAEIQFDPALFAKDANDPKIHKLKNEDLKITQVVIEGNDPDIKDHASGVSENGFTGIIKVKFKYLIKRKKE